MRETSAARALGVAGLVMLSALTGCGSEVAPGAGGSAGDAPTDDGSATSPSDAGTATATAAPPGATVDPDTVLVTRSTILQEPGGQPQLCLGGVAESYPPQCGGPEVVGLDWADVPGREEASGVTWGEAFVVGTYDGERFTLTEPPSAEPPAGWEPPEAPPSDFPQLCDDPHRGGDEGFDPNSETGMAAQGELGAMLESLEGYVGSWVSDGSSFFNVLVTGDAEQAHAALREVWPGPLCVEQRDVATADDLQAAQEALHAGAAADLVLSSGAGGTDGLLHVGVVLADPATVGTIHELVSPWLTPEQVKVTGALLPLDQ